MFLNGDLNLKTRKMMSKRMQKLAGFHTEFLLS